MADENFTSTKLIAEIDDDSFNEVTLLLERAHGILDVIYTLQSSAGDNPTSGLHEESLSAALDASMVTIEKARKILLSSSTIKKG